MCKLLLNAILVTSAVSASPYSFARDQISIVGSSTVYPFATVVAERFGKSTSFSVPKIESTGSGGGLKLFCSGVGENSPDITNASRKIKTTEVELCKKNGVNEIIEVKIGYDGIAFANSVNAPQIDLSVEEIYMALAKVIPDENGKLVPNPYTMWQQVNGDLPDIKIEVRSGPQWLDT